MNPSAVISILKLVVDEAPAVMRVIEEIRKGKEPTEADWKELELLGSYTSEDAKKMIATPAKQPIHPIKL